MLRLHVISIVSTTCRNCGCPEIVDLTSALLYSKFKSELEDLSMIFFIREFVHSLTVFYTYQGSSSSMSIIQPAQVANSSNKL